MSHRQICYISTAPVCSKKDTSPILMWLPLTNFPWCSMASGASLSSIVRQRFSKLYFHHPPSPMDSWYDLPFPESCEDVGFPSLQNAYNSYLLALKLLLMLKTQPTCPLPWEAFLLRKHLSSVLISRPPTECIKLPCWSLMCGLSYFALSAVHVGLLFRLWASGVQGERAEFHLCTPRTCSWAGAHRLLTEIST